MGFACVIEAPMAEGDGPTLIEWLKPVGSWMDCGDPIFALTRSNKRYTFNSNMPGVLREHYIKSGSELVAGDAVGVAEVDGDEIPYGRPYVVAA